MNKECPACGELWHEDMYIPEYEECLDCLQFEEEKEERALEQRLLYIF